MDKWRKDILVKIILFSIIISLNKSIFIAFVSIILHELAHIIIAKKNGCKFNNFQLHIYGTNAEFINIDELRKNEKLEIYLAGPITNIIIICIFFFLELLVNISFTDNLIKINFNLALFNLLPAYPLDGARILEIILEEKMLYKRVNNIISKISYIIATFLLCVFIILFLYNKVLNISLLMASIIIFFITRSEQKSAMYILMGNIFKKRKKLLRNNYIENKSISVYYKLGLANVMKIIDKNKFNTFYVLDDDLKVLFIMNEDELIEALKLYGNITLEEYFYKRNKVGN